MKKLKIFLLLSILLCIGFTLSSEVHAEEITDLTGTKWLLPENLNLASSINGNFDIDLSPYEIDLNTLIKLQIYYEGSNSITTWEEFIDLVSNLITDVGGTNVVNNLVIEDDKNNYLIVPTMGFLEIVSYEEGGILWYGLDLTSADNFPVVSGTLTFEHPDDGTITLNFVELFNFFFNPSEELWDEMPMPTLTSIIDPLLSTITITGGDDVTNPTLIAWLEANATLIPPAKPFEIGDELPAGNIKISWDFTGYPISDSADFVILGDNDLNIVISEWDEDKIEMEINFDERFNLVTPGYTIITLTSPETITDLYNGNIYSSDDYYDYVHGAIFWEALPPEYLGDYDDLYDGELLDIEEDYILPEGQIGIKLLYNNTGGTKSGTVTYTFGTYGQIILTAQEDNLSTQVTSAEITYNFTNPNWEIYMIDDSLAEQTFGSTRGILFAGVLLDFSWASTEERTITDITVEGDLDIDVIFTRILTEEEIIYQEGYSAGYQTAREIFGWKDGDTWYNGIDAWNLGEKYARELYGFYDSTTDEWLSVDEYVARYGTDKMNQSDFYNNFDKYFIPAMIIVFGGAIVLTILKVFKGRE